jgi:colicin import membrane protein
MSLEATDRSKSWVFKAILIGVTLASVLIPPSAAQHKENHASVWGPMFRSQVERCWKKPRGDAAANIEAGFKISLTRDGMLTEQPLAESPATSDYVKAYQQSAVRALNACQPYKLPAEYYEEWKLFVPVFSGRKANPTDGLFNARTPSICQGC